VSSSTLRPLAFDAGFRLSKPVTYLTILSLFSAALYVHVGIDLRIFYFIILLCSAVVLLSWNWRLNGYHILALIYLWVSGMLAISRETDTLAMFLSQSVGITICSLFFYLFLRQKDVDFKTFFLLYCQFAFHVAWIGLVLLPIQSIIHMKYIRLQSIMLEPAHFATVIFPAAFFYISQKNFRLKGCVMWLALVLTGSAVAFFGIIIGIILLSKQSRPRMALGFALVVLFGTSAYFVSPEVRTRVDDSWRSVFSFDVTGSNLSTFAILSNAYVTYRVLEEHPWFGIGLGGHQLAHKEFIGDLPGVEDFEDNIDINAPDANSLLLRAGSELGLFGVCLLLFFVYRFYFSGSSPEACMSAGILIYFALKFLRDGHWFSPELYFFLWIYVFLWMENRQVQRATRLNGSKLVRKPSFG